MIKKFWTVQNDEKLLKLIELLGREWTKIAQIFNVPFITPKEVKDRYRNKLNPSLKRSRFDKEEDKVIL